MLGKALAPDNADIVARADGSVWFSSPRAHRIAAITPDSTVRDIDVQLPPGAEPSLMAALADGSVWYTDRRYGGGVGRIAADGTVTRLLQGQAVYITGIAAGHDGSVWFSQQQPSAIGHVMADGKVVRYPMADDLLPGEIVPAMDGNIWFADWSGAMGRLARDGEMTLFRRDPWFEVGHIAPARDGRVWFTTGSLSADALGWLPPNACASHRRFTLGIRSYRGDPVSTADVLIGGVDGTLHLTGPSPRVLVDLRGYLPGTVTVTASVRTVAGERYTDKRVFHTCQARR